MKGKILGYTLALTSLVSAQKPDLVDQTELPALSMATCYGFANDRFYDITDFNKAFRDYDSWYPWYVDLGDGNTFYYKTCQASWAMTPEEWAVNPKFNAADFNDESWPIVSDKGVAYVASGSNRTYTFDSNDIESLPKVNGTTYPEGWTIAWTSNENCTTNASQKYEVIIKGECVDEANETSDMANGLFTVSPPENCTS